MANDLAKELSKEADSCLYNLRVLTRLADLLRDIEHPIQIDDQIVEAAINEQLGTEIDDFLEPVGFVRTDASFETTFYATEDPNLLYIEFTAEFVCEDVTEEGRKNALLRLIGDGSYNHAATSFSDLRPTELSNTYLSREGKQEGKTIISGVGHSLIGHRRVSHVVRRKLTK